MKAFSKLNSTFFLVFFLFLNIAIGQSSQQRLMLLPGKYSLIGNSINLGSVCIDGNRSTPFLSPSDIKIIRQGDIKVKIEGISTFLSLSDALAQGLLVFNTVDDYHSVSISPTPKTKNKKIEIEISKGAVIGESAQDQDNINEALFEIDWQNRENIQSEVWRIQDGYLDKYSQNTLLDKLEIEALILKKQYNVVLDKIKVTEELQEYLNYLDLEYHENKFLNKEEIKSLIAKKQFAIALAKFKTAESLNQYLDYLDEYYARKLLNKVEIDALFAKKQYDIALAKFKTAENLNQYLDYLDEYYATKLLNKAEIESLLAKKQYDIVLAKFNDVEELLDIMPSINEGYEYKLLNKAEIEDLITKKQYNTVLTKFQSIEYLLDLMPSINEGYEYKLLDKAEIEDLITKKQYNAVLTKFQSIEHLLDLMPSITRCYEYKLLNKSEIGAIIKNKQFSVIEAKFKEKSHFYNTYESTTRNWNNYHVLGLLSNENRNSLLNAGKHDELTEQLIQSSQKYGEIINQNPALELNESIGLIKYGENYFTVKKGWWDVSVSKFEFDYAKLNRDQDNFWSDLTYYAKNSEDKPAYLYPGIINSATTSAKLRITGQEILEINANPEQIFDNILQKSIDYISSQPEDKPIFIAKDGWSNSGEFGGFSEGEKVKKIANSDIQLLNSTELYVQLKNKFPNRRNIYLGGDAARDMAFLERQKEVSPLVQGVNDVLIFKAPDQVVKVAREPLTPSIINTLQTKNLAVIDLNQYSNANSLPRNLNATKAIIVTGHNNEEMVKYLNLLADNGFLKGKYVCALTCHEDYSIPVLTEILKKGGARSMSFFYTKLNQEAVGKVLIELPDLLSGVKQESEKKELLEWLELAAGKLKKDGYLTPFLQKQYDQFSKGIQMTSEE